MRKTISLLIVLTLTFGVILASITSAGLLMVFAQSNQTKAASSSSPSSSATNQTNSSSSPPRSSSASTVHITKIKITSPSRGQQVPVGKDLTISGTSIDNATSNCQVSVIANKVRPYQPATASGTGGAADYSKWNFVLTSKYTTIKPGQNRITAKYECGNNRDLTAFSSVNVTGVQAAGTAASPSSSSSTNQTNSSSSPPSAVGANQTAAKQEQPANNTEGSGNSTANPLANIPVIGKLFGGK